MDSIQLAIFSGRLNAVCEEMGFTLQRTALSPNIKDRLDFSCAFFDQAGGICAQAAHIPVHLGSMAYAMSAIVDLFDWKDGDVVVLNDPFMGGTHLPDVTLISPVFCGEMLVGFVANRAHHAYIGSSSPGSMPLSSRPEDEGILLSPMKLYSQGELMPECAQKLYSLTNWQGRDSKEEKRLPGDFLAQLSANKVGSNRLQEWFVDLAGEAESFTAGLEALNYYGASLARQLLQGLPKGEASYSDCMDSDGFGATDIPITVSVDNSGERLVVDFYGSAAQVEGNINCPLSVTAASVYYVFACLLPEYAPRCRGVFDCVEIKVPSSCLLNASKGAAVAAGNVETSMRVVDVLLGALHKLGLAMPADSQGTMNNIAFGCHREGGEWDYYETLAGGMGAGPDFDGLSGVQCHMTNTLNTPIESLETHYPLRINEYSIRSHSGGLGQFTGGNGLRRCYEFLNQASLTVLSERRRNSPRGRAGSDGLSGSNSLNGVVLPDKVCRAVKAGDRLQIETPGGGGWSEITK